MIAKRKQLSKKPAAAERRKICKLSYLLVGFFTTVSFLCYGLFRSTNSHNFNDIGFYNVVPLEENEVQNRSYNVVPLEENEGKKRSKSLSKQLPMECTREEQEQIARQLIPTFCIKSEKRPWYNRCSFTLATKCPNATWLSKYYYDMFHRKSDLDGIYHDNEFPFVGISVGCNKGYDALDAMRMGTFDKRFDKAKWLQEMSSYDGNMASNRCGQNTTEQFNLELIDDSELNQVMRKGEFHCIEAMPLNYDLLKQSSDKLKYEEIGFHVKNFAISKENGKLMFPTGKEMAIGIENMGLSTCGPRSGIDCAQVDVLSLQSYVDKYVKSKGPIHYLSIDVEGYDFDVLLGSGNVLNQVEYLEFEYNWMGSWAKQHLEDAINMLEDIGFVCYWAGMNRLWRITKCWISHYSTRHWSNVACVQSDSLLLSAHMEALFHETLKEENKTWVP